MQNFKFAFSSVMGHKMRSFLTMLGVIIGVTAVSVIMAMGTGMSKFITKLATEYQHDVQIYYKSGSSSDEEESGDYSLSKDAPKVKDEWLQQIVKQVDGIDNYYVTNSTTSNISYGNKTGKQIAITGASQNFFGVKKYKIIAGRQLNQSDYQQFSRFIMIDTMLAQKLFNSPEDALNQIVEVGSKSYRIVGVYKDPNAGTSSYGTESDGNAILANTQLSSEFGVDEISSIYVHVPNAVDSSQAGKQAAALLTKLSGATDGKFTMFDIGPMLKSSQSQISALTFFIGIIGGTSLLVGGIGVMNIMLVSVTERTREIGLRKALGATRRNILTQFLIESVVLTLLGGFIGLLLAYGLSGLLGSISGLVSQMGKPEISLNTILVSIGFSMGVGVIFGLLPANKASKLDPIEALRYE
ncbi:ABC transporter permease [Streptococcus dentiloxodontae]